MEHTEIENHKDNVQNPRKSYQIFSEKRMIFRKSSKIHEQLYLSLQSCSVRNNLLQLENLSKSTTSKSLKKRLDALSNILETLQIQSTYQNNARNLGILDFKVAQDLYADIAQIPTNCREDDIHTRLKDDLLNPLHGVRCLIYINKRGKHYIILDSDEISIVDIFQKLISDEELAFNEGSLNNRLHEYVNYEFIQKTLVTMDSENDQSIAKALLSIFLSRDQLESIGIRPDTARSALQKLQVVQEEIRNAYTAATDMLNLRLTKEMQDKQSKLNNLCNRESNHLSVKRKADIEMEKELLEESLNSKSTLLLQEDRYSVQKFKQATKRLAKKLIAENRIKSRRLGAGPKPLLDSDDEDFIARAIESKSSAHGRRHDSIMYLNHRVTSKDLLSIANYNLIRRGKHMIRSARTVWLRGRPRRVNTVEGKRHYGKWLFCSKKPPKTESELHETTHHQRSHVKVNRESMFTSEDMHNVSLEVSMDDKAYLRPGTDVGFRETKAGKIIDVTDQNRSRKLPQHDFAEPKVYQSPSSYRIMTWKAEEINGEVKMIKEKDQSVVVIRPKHYVPSNGSNWASDYMRIVHNHPHLFTVEDEQNRCLYSNTFQSIGQLVRDIAFHFQDTFSREDLDLLPNEDAKCYLSDKLTAIHSQFIDALESYKTCLEEEKLRLHSLMEKLNDCLAVCETIRDKLGNANLQSDLQPSYNILLKNCKEIISLVDRYGLPQMKTVITELTDAGPGVGSSNIEVRFRMAEIARIHSSDRRLRIHRARGDSAQNEVERTNSAIGDALVDGATLTWERFKAFDGMTEEEIKDMTIEDIKMHKEMIMEKNVWSVAEEVKLRVDDQKGPGGDFMIAHVTPKPAQKFFQDRECLMKYYDVSKANQKKVPGHAYYDKMQKFMNLHCEQGELYLEYRKRHCIFKQDMMCNFCTDNPPLLEKASEPSPRPYPDYGQLPSFHYMPYKETPLFKEDGLPRNVDDFQPRVQLKKLFSEDKIMSNSEEEIKSFSLKYIVDEQLIRKYINHLETLKNDKEKRQLIFQKRKMDDIVCSYEQYNWKQLFEERQIAKLSVNALDKYIERHQLGKHKLKRDKIKIVTHHIGKTIFSETAFEDEENDSNGDTNEENDEVDSDGDTSSDEDNDIILEKLDSSEISEESDPDEYVPVVPDVKTTRGRRISMPSRFRDFI